MVSGGATVIGPSSIILKRVIKTRLKSIVVCLGKTMIHSLPFDVAFEHCNHDYVKLLHCHTDHIVAELQDVGSVFSNSIITGLELQINNKLVIQMFSHLRSNFHNEYRGTRHFTLNLLEKCLDFFIIMHLMNIGFWGQKLIRWLLRSKGGNSLRSKPFLCLCHLHPMMP